MTGFQIDNERPDIQLAHDRDEGEKRENYWNSLHNDIPIARCAESEDGATKLSDAVRKLVRKGGGKRLFFKEALLLDVDWSDIETEISLEAITPDGWDSPLTDSDNINVVWHEPGSHQIEICVELFNPDETI